ncbi:MAG: DNA-3-methyladenine glycosylase I [Arenicella sp.]|jgi:DNA-3-methyladenine glycosylase I
MSNENSAVEQDSELDCAWTSKDPQYITYHDEHWGRPVTDSRELFAKLCLDGQQAGLSWLTILRKQANYEKAFYHFDPQRIIQFTEDDVARLMQDKGIVRNKLKINSVIKNSRGYLAIEKEMSFSTYIWQFTDFQVINNQCENRQDVVSTSPESYAMSKALKKLGFSFVGETICYAFMQAIGMVNDHIKSCARFAELNAENQQLKQKLKLMKAEFESARLESTSLEKIHIKNG